MCATAERENGEISLLGGESHPARTLRASVTCEWASTCAVSRRTASSGSRKPGNRQPLMGCTFRTLSASRPARRRLGSPRSQTWAAILRWVSSPADSDLCRMTSSGPLPPCCARDGLPSAGKRAKAWPSRLPSPSRARLSGSSGWRTVQAPIQPRSSPPAPATLPAPMRAVCPSSARTAIPRRRFPLRSRTSSARTGRSSLSKLTGIQQGAPGPSGLALASQQDASNGLGKLATTSLSPLRAAAPQGMRRIMDAPKMKTWRLFPMAAPRVEQGRWQ